MTIVINQMDNNLWEYLYSSKAVKMRGKVISKFERVINIEFTYPHFLVAFALDSVISSPYMMKTNNVQSFIDIRDSVNIGHNVYLKADHTLIIGNFELIYTQARRWNSHLPEVRRDHQYINNNYCFLKDYLTDYGKPKGIRNAYLFLEEKINNTQIETAYDNFFMELLYKLDNELSYENIKQFMGLGVGLTPSGDDFITGLLAVLYCYAPESLEVKKIFHSFKMNDFQSKTTTISFYMIRHILQGRVNAALRDYLLFNHEDSFVHKQSADSVLEIGSTSGTDMLVGVCFGLRYLQKK